MKSLTTLLCLLLLVTSAQALPDTRPATTQTSPLARSRHQTEPFFNIADRNGLAFNFIISPRTRTVSRPLQLQVRKTGGITVEFDAQKGTFRFVGFQGNKVVR